MYRIATFQFLIRESLDDELDTLAQKVRQGDAEAFDLIDMKLRPMVRRMSYRYSSAHYEQEDMEQDMMERAFRLCYRFEDDRGHYLHYLFRTLRFEMLSFRKRRKDNRTREYIEDDQSDQKEADEEDEASNPANIIVKEEQLDYLLNGKGICSPMEKRVLRLLSEGHGIDEVCLEFALERRDVFNALHRIRRKKERMALLEEAEGTFDNMA